MIRFVCVLIILFIGNCLCVEKIQAQTKPGAYATELYLKLLKGKNIGVVANQTSVIGSVSLIDTLVKSGITIKKNLLSRTWFQGHSRCGSNGR